MSSSVHDARIFLNSSINGMLQNRIIPPSENILVEGRAPVSVFLLGWPCISSSSIFNDRIFWRWKKWKEKVFSYKLSSARIPVENSFRRLKAWFKCFQRAMDVKLDTLPQILYSCFVLHNYCENKKENLPDQNLMSALSFDKRVQPSTSSLCYEERVNENKTIFLRNTLTSYFE